MREMGMFRTEERGCRGKILNRCGTISIEDACTGSQASAGDVNIRSKTCKVKGIQKAPATHDMSCRGRGLLLGDGGCAGVLDPLVGRRVLLDPSRKDLEHGLQVGFPHALYDPRGEKEREFELVLALIEETDQDVA